MDGQTPSAAASRGDLSLCGVARGARRAAFTGLWNE